MARSGYTTIGLDCNPSVSYLTINFEMDIDGITQTCTSFPAVEYEIKWKSDLVFMVGRKMFCQVDLESPLTATCFKVPEDDFEELCALPNFRPAPYFGQHKWIMVEDASKLGAAEWRRMLRQSYELVKGKLSKRKRAALGID